MNPSLERITLITGGARSGKSRHALALLEGDRSVTYIATAEALDDDMRGRIARHRSERKAEWATVEGRLRFPPPCEAARRRVQSWWTASPSG